MAYTAISGSADLHTTIRYVDSWNFSENAGSPAAARVLLRDGGVGGPVVADIRLAASDSKSQAYFKPLYFPLGLYVLVSTGTIRGGITGS